MVYKKNWEFVKAIYVWVTGSKSATRHDNAQVICNGQHVVTAHCPVVLILRSTEELTTHLYFRSSCVGSVGGRTQIV